MGDMPTPVVTIGSIVGGISDAGRAWDQTIDEAFRSISVPEWQPGELRLNVEFQIAGHLLQPDFEGVRTGRFRKTDALLKVQVAVVHVATLPSHDQVLTWLRSAIELAITWAARRQPHLGTALLQGILSTEAKR